jgi:hypothetical protein
MLKTMKYKTKIEEGKQLIEIQQEMERFPVTTKIKQIQYVFGQQNNNIMY